MRRITVFLSFLLAGFMSTIAIAQEDRIGRLPGGEDTGRVLHLIRGNITLHEPDESNLEPRTFTIVLEFTTGQVFGRDTVSGNGTFRFQNVRNGEYYLKVLMNEKLVYREEVILQNSRPLELQKNIELQYGGADSGLVETGTVYARSGRNRELYAEAQEKMGEGKSKDAVKILNQVVEDDPGDYEAWTELGTVYFGEDKLKDAEKAYEKALEAKDDFLLAMINLGNVRVNRKDFDGAIEVLSKAVEMDPERAETNYLLGESYLQLKKGSKAVGYLYEAIRLDPEGMAELHLRLAQLYNGAGYKDRAANEYRQFLEKRPDYAKRKELEEYIAKNGR